MYVAVKGGERAIDNAHRLLAHKRRGRKSVPELTAAQIRHQLGRAIDRVMRKARSNDADLAAIAIKQACGDLIERFSLCAPIGRPCRGSLRRTAGDREDAHPAPHLGDL